MLSSYAVFNGTEIWNHNRLVAYLTGNLDAGFLGLRQRNTSVNPDCGCSSALPLFCDQGSGPDGQYISPALDLAPWYDPDIPESEEFAGLFVEDITGFDSVVARDTADGAVMGTSLGPLRLKGRAITVTGWLRAKTCCGAEYGLRWLQEALLGNNFCSDCATGDLYMLKCCPPDTDTCHSTSETSTIENDTPIHITVTDLGNSSYTILIDDPQRVDLVSLLDGVANNTDGYLTACVQAGDTPSFGFTTTVGTNAVNLLLFPGEGISAVSTAPSTNGAEISFTFDTAIVSDCDDTNRWLAQAETYLQEWIVAHGSGVAVTGYVVADLTCYTMVDGIDPLDYIRLFHRTGLTDGPKVVERHGTCCSTCGCTNLKVQFTLTTELPYIYSDINYCIEEEPFPTDCSYCLDLRTLCPQCSAGVGTKAYERQIPRPEKGIIIRHDQSWCADGWDITDGCPPADSILVISEITPYTPPDATSEQCADDKCSESTDKCPITLYADLTWSETGAAWFVSDGFPPKCCELTVDGSGTCDPNASPPDDTCLIRVIYNAETGAKTWEPIRWDGSIPWPLTCKCIVIAETCYIGATPASDPPTPCVIPTDCPILVNCFGAWTPDGWTHDPNAVFPDPDCNYYIANVQDTSPITETVYLPADEFVPDCGPVPVPPPAPFLISTDCYCEPWETYRQCCTLKNPGDWNDATTFVEIWTGGSEMRRLKIEAYQNPFGDAVPCPCDPTDEFWTCRTPCASILVPQLPANSKLTIDSRLHSASLLLSSGRSVNAARYIYAADGGPFGWLDISQCSTFCIVVSVDVQFVASDAWVTIGSVNRYLASGW